METIKDIVADIRAQNQGLPEDGYALSPYVHDLLSLADRIEAAYKRETVTQCNHFNGAKVRDALELASRVIHCAIAAGILKGDDAQAAFFACRNALAEPPEPISNNAKIREVLVELAKDFREHEESASLRSPAYSSMFGCFAERIEKVLAEPPRNCDLPTVIADPHSAWLKDSDNWDDFGSPEKEIHDWLLAKAKGENNE